MNKSSTTKAYIAAITQAVMVGFSFLALKIALNNADTLDLLAHRYLIAVITVILVILFGYGGEKLTFHIFIRIAPYGLVFPIAMFFFQTLGMQHVSTSESGIINALAPIITLIIAAILLHEHITFKQGFFMIMSVCGVIFINCMNGFNISNYSFFGTSMIVLSVIALSLYGVLIKRISSQYSAFHIAASLNIVGFLFFNVIAIIKHVANNTLSGFFDCFSHTSYILSLVFLGVCCSLITAILNAYALQSLPAVSIGLLNNLSTIVSILAGVLILHEAFYWYHIVGIIVILVGTIAFNFVKNKK